MKCALLQRGLKTKWHAFRNIPKTYIKHNEHATLPYYDIHKIRDVTHIDNVKLLLICILLISHSFIFGRFYFFLINAYVVVLLFNTVIYVFSGGPRPPLCGSSIALRHTTVGRTPLDEWSARRTDLSSWQHTTLTRHRHPCPRLDSNPQSQQAMAPDRATSGIDSVSSSWQLAVILFSSYHVGEVLLLSWLSFLVRKIRKKVILFSSYNVGEVLLLSWLSFLVRKIRKKVILFSSYHVGEVLLLSWLSYLVRKFHNKVILFSSYHVGEVLLLSSLSFLVRNIRKKVILFSSYHVGEVLLLSWLSYLVRKFRKKVILFSSYHVGEVLLLSSWLSYLVRKFRKKVLLFSSYHVGEVLLLSWLSYLVGKFSL